MIILCMTVTSQKVVSRHSWQLKGALIIVVTNQGGKNLGFFKDTNKCCEKTPKFQKIACNTKREITRPPWCSLLSCLLVQLDRTTFLKTIKKTVPVLRRNVVPAPRANLGGNYIAAITHSCNMVRGQTKSNCKKKCRQLPIVMDPG